MKKAGKNHARPQKLGKNPTQVERLGQTINPEWKDDKPLSGKELPT
jgi:hypothetical protein